MRVGATIKGGLLGVTLALLGAGASWAAADNGAALKPVMPTPEQAEFFEAKVRPLLFQRCFSCHGDKAQMGGLRLDSLAAMLHGGGSGGALVPGDTDKSLLVKAVHYDGQLKMPPSGKLAPAEIEILTAWVKMGAPWPGAKSVPAALLNANGEYTLTDAQKKWWSLQPVRKPAPPKVKNAAWARNPIDKFLLAKMEAKGLAPALPADKRTLIRRAYFDLIGLPPKPEDIAAFTSDTSPSAFAKVVDKLLADPRYGERWGRHWLDVARYADTKGYTFQEDSVYHNAYNYRDWVVRAFNENLPYDQFVTQQLAADRLATGDDKRSLAALGFVTLGRRFLNDPVLINDDRIDVTTRGLLGLTVACARCHNHKFDPIPAKDYYSLYGVFASSDEPAPQSISPKAVTDAWNAYQDKHKQTGEAGRKVATDEIARLKKMPDAAQSQAESKLPPDAKAALTMLRGLKPEMPTDDKLAARLEPAFSESARTQLKTLRDSVAELEKHAPPAPQFAQTLTDKPKPYDEHIFIRGNPGNQGDLAPRRFLLCLAGPERKPFAQGSGRLELAQAIASKSNPLTARVFVNRVWLYHFGQGIVRTPSDFGIRGEAPTHPELLDWLAASFMDSGWDVKKLHRMILLSNAWQQSSDSDKKDADRDPENRLLARQNRQRLDLESLRDSLLWASGKLDPTIGGPAVELTTAPYTTRRTLYGFINRQNLQGLYRTFDFASPDTSSAQRFRTTVPQQALFMMNSPFIVEQAQSLAKRPEVAAVSSPAKRVQSLYRLLFGRAPDKDELALGLRFVTAPDKPAGAAAVPVWRYGFGFYDPAQKRVTEYTPFGRFADNRWMASEQYPDPKAGWAALTAEGGHPGNDLHHAAIRRWTAPYDAILTVRATLSHPSDQGDGVHALVVSSRQGVVGETMAQHGESKISIADVVVKRGDTLDFVVDCRGNVNFDSFRFAPVIRVSGGSGLRTATQNDADTMREWDAASQFGMGDAPKSEMTAWERYIQALLMTNEFAFVD